MLQVCNAPAVWLLKTILTLDIRGGWSRRRREGNPNIGTYFFTLQLQPYLKQHTKYIFSIFLINCDKLTAKMKNVYAMKLSMTLLCFKLLWSNGLWSRQKICNLYNINIQSWVWPNLGGLWFVLYLVVYLIKTSSSKLGSQLTTRSQVVGIMAVCCCSSSFRKNRRAPK